MVSIIILSYNTKYLLKSCLDSIFINLSGFSPEVIVVDNTSSDGSAEMVRRNFRKAIVLESEKNLGFAAGNNLGAQRASGDFLLFLNSDTQILDNKIIDLVKLLEKDKSIAAAGGELKDLDGNYQRSFCKFYNVFDIFFLLFGGRNFELKRFQTKNIREVDWITGAFMLVRKSIFDQIGGFDKNFFMYIEDMELCFRIKKKGYKVLFVPQVAISHKGQGSSNRSFAIIQIYKGLAYFFRKHGSFFEYLIVLCLLYLKAFLAIIVGIFTGNNYLLKSYRQAIRF